MYDSFFYSKVIISINIQTGHRAFYFFKSFGAYVGVYFGGLAAFVPLHFLNIPQGVIVPRIGFANCG
jgi:hypothetical protein